MKILQEYLLWIHEPKQNQLSLPGLRYDFHGSRSAVGIFAFVVSFLQLKKKNEILQL